MRVAPPLKSFPQNLHLTYGQVSYSLPVIVTPDWSHARRQLLGRLARLDVGLRRRSRGKASTADGLRLTSVDDFDTGVRQCRHWRAWQQAALVPVWLLILCIVPAGIAWRDIAGCRRAGALTTAFGATRATPQCIHLYSAVEALTDQSEYTY